MRKYFIQICLFLSLTIPLTAGHADTTHNDLLNNCMYAVSNDPDFQAAMSNDIFQATPELTQEIVTLNKHKVFGAIGSTMLLHCPGALPRLTRVANGKVWWKNGGKNYAFQFKMEDLFSYLNIPAGIWVHTNKNLSPGDIVKLSDIKRKYWSQQCADHKTIDGIDNGTGVNSAAQQTMAGYAASGNEFFLDFEETGDFTSGRRAFPGLVIMDHGGSTKESVVAYSNLHTAVNVAENFANKMAGTACARDGMAVYVVSLDTRPDDRSGTDQAFAWGAGIVGGATLLVGASALTGVGTSTAVMGAAIAAGPVGWVIAGVAAVAAGVTALLWTENLADIQQIAILDGPYIVK
ncbi:MAG: hypothetical protein J6K82_03115 [Alphaproteobacteria bacterium]|nr:hypothetical protein [Alphaproteobacteria bacterium]